MRRREFIALSCGTVVALPSLVRAQAGRIPKVGILWHAGSPEEEGRYFTGMVQGFRDLGYEHGRNIILEHRFPNEIPERFRSMADELVALKVDVLVAVGTGTAPYAHKATSTIPVVFLFVPDAVGSGFVESLGRPGRNMTGLSNFGADIIPKRLQYLKEVIPGLTRVALIVNPEMEAAPLYRRITDAAAEDLGLENHTFEGRSIGEVELALDRMVAAGMQGVTIN